MKEISIVITMDCEPVTTGTHSAATGPDSTALGERAATGYAETARSFGFPISYFIHPEMALTQPDVFLGLERQGACIGLHMHPWKYSMSRHGGRKFFEHYGGLTEAAQREILCEASALWREALGRHPVYFRPGTFSANDSVFKVLEELGFRGGSCSLPGRMMPEFRANWVGTVPDPHRGHASFRLLEGDLDFAEMPLSTDFTRSYPGKIGGRLHPDLRPDIDWTEVYGLTYREIADGIVSGILERAPRVPVINLVSHNHFDYSNPDHPASRRFLAALQAIEAACSAAGVSARGSTMAEVCDLVLATGPTQSELVCEGGVYGRPGERVASLGAPVAR